MEENFAPKARAEGQKNANGPRDDSRPVRDSGGRTRTDDPRIMIFTGVRRALSCLVVNCLV